MADKTRKELYEQLDSQTGRTPLATYKGHVPNCNTLFIKRECDNPFGSHYDRVYLALFRHFEKLGNITQGNKVLETTSGTAGVSYAGIGRVLGYDCHVAIPKKTDAATLDAIEAQGATIYFTPEEDYIAGFPRWLKRFLPAHKDFSFLNHSMGPRHGPAYTNNEVTLGSLESIAREVMDQVHIDIYLPAVGNGSSVLGPGRVMPNSTRIIAFESFQSGVTHELKYPGEYEKRYGIKIGTLPRHALRGTSFPGIDFPHIQNAVEQGVIDDVMLVSDEDIDRNYFALTGRKDLQTLPHWDSITYEDLGRTGRAGIAAALEVAKSITGKNLLILAYDKAERYDT